MHHQPHRHLLPGLAVLGLLLALVLLLPALAGHTRGTAAAQAVQLTPAQQAFIKAFHNQALTSLQNDPSLTADDKERAAALLDRVDTCLQTGLLQNSGTARAVAVSCLGIANGSAQDTVRSLEEEDADDGLDAADAEKLAQARLALSLTGALQGDQDSLINAANDAT